MYFTFLPLFIYILLCVWDFNEEKRKGRETLRFRFSFNQKLQVSLILRLSLIVLCTKVATFVAGEWPTSVSQLVYHLEKGSVSLWLHGQLRDSTSTQLRQENITWKEIRRNLWVIVLQCGLHSTHNRRMAHHFYLPLLQPWSSGCVIPLGIHRHDD